jgi:hypothetical protein
MTIDWPGLFAVLGPLSICVMFIVLALLSRRLGKVTRVRPFYIGLYLGALLVGVSLVARVINLGLGPARAAELNQRSELVLIYTGLLALGVTIGVFSAWRYWSWLFAERD